MGHSVQDSLKRTLVYRGIFFITAVKKSPGIKILSLLITKARKFMTSERSKYDPKKVKYDKKCTIYSRDRSKRFGKVLENERLFSQ